MSGYEPGAEPVTRDGLRAAIESAMRAVLENPAPPPHQHVVSPRAMERKGWARCADCFGPVWLGEPT